MKNEIAVRAAALYVPLLLTTFLALTVRPSKRRGAGILLACLWNAISLPAVNVLAIRLGWWEFSARGAVSMGVPVDLYLGWVVLWGAIPALAFFELPLWAGILAMAGVDVIFMPQLVPIVRLGPAWLIGEVAAVALCLFPSQLLARCTERNERLPLRACMQAAIFAAFYFWLLPELTKSFGGEGWSAALAGPAWVNSIAFQVLAIPMLLGVAALQEFCRRGRGTPLPFDPPRYLVTSGPYAYIANPMQLATVLLLVSLSAWLHSPMILLAALVSFIYSAGVAHWDESNDMVGRFGSSWEQYRAHVRAWRLRWRPWHPSQCDARATKAKLYVAEFCGPCSEIRAWFEAHHPVGLLLIAAEDHPTRKLRRILYVSEDGLTEREGLAAVAAAWQHIDLRWAALGWLMALPVLCQFLQLLMDATGVSEPRELEKRSAALTQSEEEPLQVQVSSWLLGSYFHEGCEPAAVCHITN